MISLNDLKQIGLSHHGSMKNSFVIMQKMLAK